MIETVREIDSLRVTVRGWRREGRTVALVPTMGALHAGHVSLITRALAAADRVVATIFVNPKQFDSATDLAAYPRSEGADSALLTAAGAHLLFAPSVSGMYPAGHATTVSVVGLTDVLCGAHRPGHFAGVTTVVAKLLLQTLPDIAVFGEKDFQQLTIIKRMVADLDIPVTIIGAPTLRDPDGLAMSSRNAYLTADERRIAPALFSAIRDAAMAIRDGDPVPKSLESARARILAAGFGKIDYVEARAESDLGVLADRAIKGRIFAAAHLGRARLIDNVSI